MSNYARKVELRTVYGGDEIVVQMHPLRFADFNNIQAKVKDGEMAMISEFYEMLPRYVITISGAKDAANAEVGIDDLASAYWTGLVTQMMLKLISDSQPPDPT